jgi:hypothetical protein
LKVSSIRLVCSMNLKRTPIHNKLGHVTLFVAGGAIAYFLSLVPKPLLHLLIYRDVLSEWIVIIVPILTISLLALILTEKRYLGLSRKKLRRMLFIGIAFFSFVLAFITFMSYPTVLNSKGYGWLTGGTEYYLGNSVNLSSVAFFIASILWDTVIGSLFGFLEHVLNQNA